MRYDTAYLFIVFVKKKNGQSGGASRWRVCYQRGLPRLVFKLLLGWSLVFWDLIPCSASNWIFPGIHWFISYANVKTSVFKGVHNISLQTYSSLISPMTIYGILL